MKAIVRTILTENMTCIPKETLVQLRGREIEVEESSKGSFKGAGWMWKREWLAFLEEGQLENGVTEAELRDGVVDASDHLKRNRPAMSGFPDMSRDGLD